MNRNEEQMPPRRGNGAGHQGHPAENPHARQARPGQRPSGRRQAPTPMIPATQAHAGDGGHTYNHDDLVRVRRKRKTHRKGKRIALIVVAVLVVLIGATTAFGAWYVGSLAGNMAMDEQDAQELSESLAGSTDDISSQPFYVLIMGSDNWENYGERSDAMILTRIDPVQHKVTMVSVPRDTPYYLNGSKVKINEAFAQEGPAGAVQAVQELTGVDVSYYVEVEFAGLADFVDSIGGIYVDVPYAFDYEVYTHDQPAVHVDAGEQLLNGEECVALARMRTAYGDNQEAIRQSNIRAMTLALINSVLQASPVEIPGLVQKLSSCVSTNMDMNDLISLAMNFASSDGTTIYTCTGPYEGDIDSETQLWLCYEDPEGWADLMAKVDAGEDPSSAETQVEGK